jgi:Tol biopolymer transport system component
VKLARRLAVAMAAGLTVMTAVPAGAATPVLPKNGDLVIVAVWDTIAIQRGAATQPYTAITTGERPKFSPDGKVIAFYRQTPFGEGDGVYIRYLINGAEIQIRKIGADGTKVAVAWSPDGKELAMSNGTKLDRVTVATGAVSTVWTGPAGTKVDGPAWSPDGSRIAFSTGNTIKLIHPDGTNLRTLTSSPAGTWNTYPDWSPDSQKIAFITSRYGDYAHNEMVTLPRSGAGEPFRVSYQAFPQGYYFQGVAWSPDGKKIAALQSNDTYPTDPADFDERTKVRGYLPDGSYSYSLTGPISGDDAPPGLDWAPQVAANS